MSLEVTGRKSGRVVRFPLGMADLAGQWYLVSMLGEHCNWVLNVRSAGGRAVIRHGRAVHCRLVFQAFPFLSLTAVSAASTW